MPTTQADVVRFHDYHPDLGDFREEVLTSLRLRHKYVSPKFFYNQRGSELFEQISRLDEYYPTRTEIAILEQHAEEIAALLGDDAVIIEYGSGNSRKIRILLDAVKGHGVYVAVDISKQHLIESATQLSQAYPELEVVAVCADYTKPFPLPGSGVFAGKQKVAFFPGSTIGNFEPPDALAFLSTVAQQVGPGGSLLLGVDLKKDPGILHAAYNDKAGITAAFNCNLLSRMNTELGADFDLSAFRHRAFYNEELGRVEMHLESLKDQTVRLDGVSIPFRRGETIHTENSYKYNLEELQQMAARAGFDSSRTWTDPDNLFSLHYLTVAGD